MGCKNGNHWSSEMHRRARGRGGVAKGEERGVAENKHGGERGGKREKNLTCPPQGGRHVKLEGAPPASPRAVPHQLPCMTAAPLKKEGGGMGGREGGEREGWMRVQARGDGGARRSGSARRLTQSKHRVVAVRICIGSGRRIGPDRMQHARTCNVCATRLANQGGRGARGRTAVQTQGHAHT